MSKTEPSSKTVEVAVEHIGGIDRTEATIEPGVTVLTGRNATNRTSFQQALMAALGSDRASLKADADEGHVELSIGDDTYTRQLSRRNGTVVTSGDPYLDEPVLADLFAFLLESNEARQAVTRGDDLREIIMRPVDTAAIQAETTRLEAERTEIDSRLEELSSLEDRLPELEAERTQLNGEIEETRTELQEIEAELDATDADLGETREEKADLDTALAELREQRSTLDDIGFRIERERDSLSAIREEYRELESERADLPDEPTEELTEVEARLDQLRERQSNLDAAVNELQTIVEFNEEMLEGTNPEIVAALRDEESGSVTDRLVDDGDTVTCWTCGSEVETAQIEETLDRLRAVRREKIGERRAVREDLDAAKDERAALEVDRRRREELDRRIERTEREIAEREARQDELEDEREAVEAEVERLERTVEEREREEYTELLDLHRQANRLEFELGRLESRLRQVTDEIEEIEGRLAEADRMRERREELLEELEELRTRIDRIEGEAVEAFNEHMDAVLDILDYANLERIWIERTEQQVREGRRTVTRSVFDLHVIRSTDAGAVYEDTVDHLSESEREVTGLVFALAGYLAHDVHEHVPFMLLDSMEAIDSNRIAALVDYLEEYPDYLVIALLPEDAAALDDDYRRITEI